MKKIIFILAIPFLTVSVSPVLAVPTQKQVEQMQQNAQKLQQQAQQLQTQAQQMQQQAQQLRQQLQPTISGTESARQQVRQEVQETVQQRQEARQGLVLQLHQNIISRIYNQITTRLEQRQQYYSQVKAQIQTRINEKIAQGKDMTAASNKLASLTSVEARLNQTISDLQVKLDEALASEKPLDLLPQLRQLVQQAQSDVQKLHQGYIDIVKLIIKS